jgi:hypothetical protein
MIVPISLWQHAGEKEKAEIQDKEEEFENIGSDDFLNESDDTTPTNNNEAKSVIAPSTSADEPTDQDLRKHHATCH